MPKGEHFCEGTDSDEYEWLEIVRSEDEWLLILDNDTESLVIKFCPFCGTDLHNPGE